MIISKRKYEERIRDAVDKAMQARTVAEEQRELRRELYGELERMRMHMNRLEARIDTLTECGRTATAMEAKG